MKTFSSSSPASLLGLATLALLGLAATPAHAQLLHLNSGDNITVSGAGTVGTLGGRLVSNATSSYSYSGAGGIYIPTVQTNGTAAFTLRTGGSISSTGDGNYGYGLLNQGSGAITISGGSITAVYGGIGLATNGSGAITISGGTFSAGAQGIGLDQYGSGTITIGGGTFSAGTNGYGLYQNGTGPVTITGGTFSAGTGGYGLGAGSGAINLFSFGGSPFLINGVAMNNTTLSSDHYGSGLNTISSTLANGDLLNTTFFDREGGIINLNIGTPPAAVPEASTTVSLGVLLALGVGGLAVARRKRA